MASALLRATLWWCVRLASAAHGASSRQPASPSPPSRVAVLFAGELRSDGRAHETLLLTQCRGAFVYVATYEPFASLALRLAAGNRSRVTFVTNLRPDATNHTISHEEAGRLRRAAGVAPLPPLTDAAMRRPLRTKGVHSRDGSPTPRPAQQWAILDVALQKFRESMLAEGITLIVRTRTDISIGEPSPRILNGPSNPLIRHGPLFMY